MKKILSLILVLCLSLAVSVTAFAAEIDTSGGTGSTPVELTTTNGGIGGGEDDIAPTKLSVTVPTALPMAMSMTVRRYRDRLQDRQQQLRSRPREERHNYRGKRLAPDRLRRQGFSGVGKG